MHHRLSLHMLSAFRVVVFLIIHFDMFSFDLYFYRFIKPQLCLKSNEPTITEVCPCDQSKELCAFHNEPPLSINQRESCASCPLLESTLRASIYRSIIGIMFGSVIGYLCGRKVVVFINFNN